MVQLIIFRKKLSLNYIFLLLLNMDIQLPLTSIQNFETIIIEQNKALIKEICDWKGWNYDQLIKEFLSENLSFNLMEQKSKSEIESRIRTHWNRDGSKYLLESISDNVYTLDGNFIGKKYGNFIDTDAEED